MARYIVQIIHNDNLEKENKVLAEKYNTKGYFPLVVVLDSKGNVLGETGYKKVSPKKYVSILNTFSRVLSVTDLGLLPP